MNDAGVLQTALIVVLVVVAMAFASICSIVRWTLQGKGLLERRVIDVATHADSARAFRPGPGL